jgi:nucleoside-diphosphate-sugar epimerase
LNLGDNIFIHFEDKSIPTNSHLLSSKMPKKFLITSASGSQGGSTARELLKQGYKVHDLPVLPSVATAIECVDGVFLNSFPDFKDPDGEVRQAQNIVDAAKAAKAVKTVVVSTVHKAAESAELTALKPEYPFLKYYSARKAGVERVVIPWKCFHFPSICLT